MHYNINLWLMCTRIKEILNDTGRDAVFNLYHDRNVIF